MSNYIFEDSQADCELQRLRLIEQALDEQSMTRLKSTGVSRGWHCLELGPGAGSIAQWLGNVVGDDGEVVAVDINTSYLRHLSGSPYRIIQGDFLDVALEDRFDLAHSRYVLIHNRHSQSMLEKLCGLLNPGGFLIAEEPDFTSARLLNHGGDPSQQRVNSAICRMFEQLQLDPGFGLTLPRRITDAGFEIVHVDSRLHLNRGGDTMARMMGQSTSALRSKYVATGEADHADIDRYIENSANRAFWSVYYSTETVIATRTTGNS